MANDLIAKYGESLTVSRTAAGSYVGGDWTPGAATPLTVVGVVVPLEPAEIAQLELGEHVKAAITIYTEVALQTSNEVTKAQADRVTWQGDVYEVQTVAARSQIAGLEHYRATAARVEGT